MGLNRLSDDNINLEPGAPPAAPLLVTPFALFMLSHSILRKAFEDCLDRGPMEPPQAEGFAIQLMLHNWLQSWLHSPEMPDYVHGNPSFLNDARPFYWILLAYQENPPPFATSSAAGGSVGALGEEKFRLTEEWLQHIWTFLRRGQQSTTLF